MKSYFTADNEGIIPFAAVQGVIFRDKGIEVSVAGMFPITLRSDLGAQFCAEYTAWQEAQEERQANIEQSLHRIATGLEFFNDRYPFPHEERILD